MSTVIVELLGVTCANCGVVFGLMDSHILKLRESGNGFYCPNGHSNVYRNSKDEQIKKLKKELDQEKRATEYWQSSYRGEQGDHEQTRRRLSATKGALTKTKRRISNGVCPCCHRTFKQLAAHMKNKHPEYQDEE